MSSNPLVRRLGLRRTSLIEQAAAAADSGLWLALRVSPEVPSASLLAFLQRWAAADLSPITDVVIADARYRMLSGDDDRVRWIRECGRLSELSDGAWMIPAGAKGAEFLCREVRSSFVALDERVPAVFEGPLFAARAEREKSFVRCAKALLAGTVEGRIERVSLWTGTPRVLGACRTAARNAKADGRYEICLPEFDRGTADRLLSEGETVRMWFTLDNATVDRAVAR